MTIPLPSAPHPIASAFFSAHDDVVEKSVTRFSTAAGKKIMRNSVGWRTRYSSSEFYPVAVLPVEGRRKRPGKGEEEGESASFHVRQIFPKGSEELGTGATVWPCSIVLLKYLEKMAHDPQKQNTLAGKSVIDLGSGTAIASIGCALLGANSVVCTDGCESVVNLAHRNIRDAISLLEPKVGEEESSILPTTSVAKSTYQFCRGCKIFAQKYRWGEGITLPLDIAHDQTLLQHNNQCAEETIKDTDQRKITFDIILASDCIVPKLYPIEPFVDAIDELCGDETVCYISHEHRHHLDYDPEKEFRRLASMRDLEVDVIPHQELHPFFCAKDIQIWMIVRRTSTTKWLQQRGRNKLRTSVDGLKK